MFYRLRACDYKEAQDHVALLDTMLRELEQPVVVSEPQIDSAELQELQHQLEWLKMELQVPGVSQKRTTDLHYHYGIVVGKLR